jgi:hypothetical protein
MTATDFSVPPAPPEPNVWAGRPSIAYTATDYLGGCHGMPCRLVVAFDQKLDDGGFDLPAGSVRAWLTHIDGKTQEVDPRLPLVVNLARSLRHTRI